MARALPRALPVQEVLLVLPFVTFCLPPAILRAEREARDSALNPCTNTSRNTSTTRWHKQRWSTTCAFCTATDITRYNKGTVRGIVWFYLVHATLLLSRLDLSKFDSRQHVCSQQLACLAKSKAVSTAGTINLTNRILSRAFYFGFPSS